MLRENVEVVQRVIEHFQETGEPDWATLDETIEVHDHDTPDQSECRGHEGLTAGLRNGEPPGLSGASSRRS